jgi:ubiquinone/menaquinone biosynthesis C-methylase UbiE
VSEYIHGGSDEREVKRLEKQAQWGAPWMLQRFDVPPNARVLDLATGVGAMAGWLLERFPGVRLVGVDLSAGQLGWARRNHPSLPVARATGAALPFADATFDRVHCSWLLEHVSADVATAILREVRRVLRPGGYCHFTEVDNSTFRTSPTSPDIDAVMAALNEAQQRGGGDPYVGQQLPRLFKAAGFEKVEISPLTIHGGGEDPVFFQGFIDEFAEIFESLDEALPGMRERAQRAAAQLRALKAQGGTMDYSATIARGFR